MCQNNVIWNATKKELTIMKNESGLTWNEFWSTNCCVSEWSDIMKDFVNKDNTNEEDVMKHSEEKLATFVEVWEENEELFRETETRYYVGTNWVDKGTLNKYLEVQQKTTGKIVEKEIGLSCELKPNKEETKMKRVVWLHPKTKEDIVTGINGSLVGTGVEPVYYGKCYDMECCGRDKNKLITELTSKKKDLIGKMDNNTFLMIKLYKHIVAKFGKKVIYKTYGWNSETRGVNMLNVRLQKVNNGYVNFTTTEEQSAYVAEYNRFSKILTESFDLLKEIKALNVEIDEAYHSSTEPVTIEVQFDVDNNKYCPHCGSNHVVVDGFWRNPSVIKEDVVNELKPFTYDLGDGRTVTLDYNGDIVRSSFDVINEVEPVSLDELEGQNGEFIDDGAVSVEDMDEDIDATRYNVILKGHENEKKWNAIRRGVNRDDAGILYSTRWNGNIKMGGWMSEFYNYEYNTTGGYNVSEGVTTFWNNVGKAFDNIDVELLEDYEYSLLNGNRDEHEYEPQVPEMGRTKAEYDRIQDKLNK